MLRVQLQHSRRFSRLVAKASSCPSPRSQLTIARPVSSTNSKPTVDQPDGNPFSFILDRLEKIRKQAARNAASFERKQAATKATSTAPSGTKSKQADAHLHLSAVKNSNNQQVPTLQVEAKALSTTAESVSITPLPQFSTMSTGNAVKSATKVLQRQKASSSLLQGQAFQVNNSNNKLVGLRRFAKGSVYVGEWLDGKMHGQGKLTCPDGSSYEGMWQHDLRSGVGIATFIVPPLYTPTIASTTTSSTPVKPSTSSSLVSDASASTSTAAETTVESNQSASYNGNWLNDTFYGTGCYTYPDGSTLTGEFVNGTLRNGHGLLQYTSTKGERAGEIGVYVGDIANYKRHGHGTFTKADGTSYTGHWLNNRRDGEGKLTYTDGRSMEGTFKDGVLHGKGKITQSDPTMYDYEGFFVQGVPQGNGKQTQRSTGNTYEGTFLGGKRHGQGKFVYGEPSSPAVSLEGSWKENKPMGQCKQLNRDGSVLRGTFKNKKVQGELIYPDREKFVGLLTTVPPYADTGRGTVRTNNTLYKGELVGGKKQGKGEFTFNVPSEDLMEEPRTQTYSGMFVDDKMHGRGVITCSEGTASGEFKDGLLYTGSGKMYVGSKLQWGRWVDGIRQNFGTKASGETSIENTTDSTNAENGTFPTTTNSDTTTITTAELTAVNTTNPNNMLQGNHTIKLSPYKTITGHFVNNYIVGNGVFTYNRNDRYVIYKGPFLKNKPHGNGVTTTNDGEWQSTYVNGIQTYGRFASYSGTHRYAGETSGFNFNGKGKYEFPGYTYDGDFKMGIRHGYGVFAKHDVFFYAGNWVENKRQGYGVNVNKQNTYKGMYYNDLQHGEGELIYNHGYTYKGTFAEGYLTNGVVTTTWGDTHSGEFTRGIRNGKGVFTFSNGVSVSGTWVEGKLHGFATISKTSSTENSPVDTSEVPNYSAKGYFENNVLKYQVTENDTPDVSTHALWDHLPVLNNDSMFAPMRSFLSIPTTDNVAHGRGEMHFSDGRVYIGMLRNGIMSGAGTLYSGPVDANTAPFGQYQVQGIFRDNMLHNCSGVLMDRDTLFECTWVEGLRQGYVKITQPSGRVLEGEYLDDKLIIAKKKLPHGKETKELTATENTNVPLTRDTIRLDKGLVYSGELSAGVPHGTGKIANSVGEVWEGVFEQGQLVKGFYSIYTGSVKDMQNRAEKDRKHIGKAGTLVLVYKGEFEDYQYHGQGKLILADSVYEGSFENGLPHGYGRCVDSQEIYEGEYSRGMRHGVGFITLPSGEVREGVWFHNFYQNTAVRPFAGGWNYSDQFYVEEK